MDTVRTEFKIEMRCSKCGQVLTMDGDKSEFQFHNAASGAAVFKVHPCERCMDDAKAPLRHLRRALELSTRD